MKLAHRDVREKVAMPGQRAYYILRTGAKIYADRVTLYDDTVYCNACLGEMSDRDKRFTAVTKRHQGKCIQCACLARFMNHVNGPDLAIELYQKTLLKLIIMFRRDVTATGTLPRHEIYVYDPLFQTVKLSRVTIHTGYTREKMRSVIERRRY